MVGFSIFTQWITIINLNSESKFPWLWSYFDYGQIIEFRNFELQGVALKHSPLQQFYNVLQFKAEYESKHGAVKSEVLAKLYEDIKFANPDDAVPWVQL